jgi:hypothetical protein
MSLESRKLETERAAFGLGSALGAAPPTGMSAQEYKVLVIRSQGLNDRYGGPEVTSQYKAMVRALRVRGEAMNRLAPGRGSVLLRCAPAEHPSRARLSRADATGDRRKNVPRLRTVAARLPW